MADDWAALQAAVDEHAVVYLPKGFYRLAREGAVKEKAGVGASLISSAHQHVPRARMGVGV